MLANRLSNRMRHLAKWARRQGTSCFRLYERDIPDYPAIIDWYADTELQPISVQNLPGDPLTVKLWSAKRRSASPKNDKSGVKRTTMEMAN